MTVKLLILCVQSYQVQKSLDIILNNTLDDSNKYMINTLDSIYALIIARKLIERKYDINISFINIRTNNINELDDHYDYIFSTINRGFTIINDRYIEILKSKCKKLITMCETATIVGPEDILFHIIGYNNDKCIRTSWGADHFYFDNIDVVKKNRVSNELNGIRTINILVDHTYYGSKNSETTKKDRTKFIIERLLMYKKHLRTINNGCNIVINHISNNKVNVVEDGYEVIPFKQTYGIDFRKIYQYYKDADIFITTHPESFGFTPIECCAAGTLIVHPKDYLRKSMVRNLYHYTIQDIDSLVDNDKNNVEWTNIINEINPEKSIASSYYYSYDKLIDTMQKELNLQIRK